MIIDKDPFGCVTFNKNKDPFGWLSNMSPFPIQTESVLCKAGEIITTGSIVWRTAEHLFQAMRVEDFDIAEGIRNNKSPMIAKFFAVKHKDKRVVVPQSEQDVENMLWVLRLKIAQHEDLRKRLIATWPMSIIEDVTKRPSGSGLFWGAALVNGEWVGDNMLGKLWKKVREGLSYDWHELREIMTEIGDKS